MPYLHLARHDPVLFIRLCMTDPAGHALDLAEVHERLQWFLTDHRRALVELPRDHGKSTQVCGRILWELGRNPALRVKIVCATEAVAAERSRFLRHAIANNRRVWEVFPHLTPGEPWAADAFTVERPAEVIGPSVAAFGIGCGSTGTRADLLICDDVVDVRSLHSKAERDRVDRLLRQQPDEPARTGRPVLGAVHSVAPRRPQRAAEAESGVCTLPRTGRSGFRAGVDGEVAGGGAAGTEGRDRLGLVRPRLPARARGRGGHADPLRVGEVLDRAGRVRTRSSCRSIPP